MRQQCKHNLFFFRFLTQRLYTANSYNRIQRERIVAFPWQQQLHERPIMLRHSKFCIVFCMFHTAHVQNQERVKG